jgi:hypothetical protein
MYTSYLECALDPLFTFTIKAAHEELLQRYKDLKAKKMEGLQDVLAAQAAQVLGWVTLLQHTAPVCLCTYATLSTARALAGKYVCLRASHTPRTLAVLSSTGGGAPSGGKQGGGALEGGGGAARGRRHCRAGPADAGGRSSHMLQIALHRTHPASCGVSIHCSWPSTPPARGRPHSLLHLQAQAPMAPADKEPGARHSVRSLPWRRRR